MFDNIPIGTCLGTISDVDSWLYYDGPKLFVATSNTGKFLGVLVDDSEDSEIYLFAATTDHRIANIASGDVPLRAGFVFPSRGARSLSWVAVVKILSVDRDLPPVVMVKRIPVSDIPADWLPEWDARLTQKAA